MATLLPGRVPAASRSTDLAARDLFPDELAAFPTSFLCFLFFVLEAG